MSKSSKPHRRPVIDTERAALLAELNRVLKAARRKDALPSVQHVLVDERDAVRQLRDKARRLGSACPSHQLGATQEPEYVPPGTMSTRRVSHFEHVDQDHIRECFSQGGSQDAAYRYLLEVPYSGRTAGDIVSVVLKNPSSARQCRADDTIRRVEAYVWRTFETCSTLRVLNLFAYRATCVNDLWSQIDDGIDSAVGPDNNCFLRDSFEESDYIVGAWGKPTHARARHREEYDDRIDQVVTLLQPHATKLRQVSRRARASSGDRTPLHGLRWGCKPEQIGNYPLAVWAPAHD